MPKALTVGNGNILVCLDKYAYVRDFYFPYVGLENHVGRTLQHRIGVWCDGEMHWLHDSTWSIEIDCGQNVLGGITRATNETLGISLVITDVVYNEKNIFLRHFSITNNRKEKRTFKLFFAHEFEIYESYTANTAYYDPITHALIHYRGRRAFLVNATHGKGSFDEYTTGVFGIEGKEGSYKDAEDGELSKNNIEHGPADSVMGITIECDGECVNDLDYWITVAESIEEAKKLNDYVIKKKPSHLIQSTSDYWSAWLNQRNFSFMGLSEDVVSLFKKSLLIVRAHSDDQGAIIASSDSDMLNQGKDTYSYMWPRDAAFSALALDKAGDEHVAHRFFEFCNEIITEDGYFMHKYAPDKALGSSWHPWVIDGKIELPIQEDETAIVLFALGEHYRLSKDLEFIEEIYNSLILKAGKFLTSFRDDRTGLPRQSFDLWEEKFGIHTYTCAAVYGALMEAANFSQILGKGETAYKFTEVAEEIKEAIIKHLYNPDTGLFYKGVRIEADGRHVPDETVDMSTAFGLFSFGVLQADDKRLERFMDEHIRPKLEIQSDVRGIVRYENDRYYRVTEDHPGNPWIITTLWLARYYIAKAKNEEDLKPAKGIFEWVVEHALDSGVLSEQLNPYTGEHLSAAPLTWSHAEYVYAIIEYLNKLEELGICEACNPVK